MKRFYYLFIFLFIVAYGVSFALTPEEILLLKRAGVPDEKILEMQKKDGTVSPQPVTPINAFDWNEDGKKDIITGSDSGQVYVYLNSGTNSQPVFDKPVKIPGVEVQRLSDPYIADYNSDGKKDVIVGQASGEVSVFINMGTNQSPLFAAEIKLNDGSLDVGQYSSVSMVDWNADGKKDLLVGNSRGNVYVFFNIGDNSQPRFSDEGMKTQISVSGYATPYVADWNGDGKFDVICGSSDGKVYIFINEGDSKNPAFGKSQILQVNNKELRLPSHTAVVPLDWDDDGKIDLLVSNKKVVEQVGGRTEETPFGIYLLMNTGTKEKPEFKELKQIKGKFRDDTVL
ncbi:MAG: VCBS repeat-containing protein [Nitrospirae bacterium]|nr:VCBS repeat-containing protein [Nitrospirota bacterium]